MEIPSMQPRNRRPRGKFWSLAFVLTLGAGVAILHSGCGEPTAIPNPADLVLHVVSGDSQIGVPFEELADPIVVQVMDTSSNTPVFNQVINFRVVEGGGSVFAGVAHTNEAGIAQEYWTMGGPGPQRLEARAVTAEGEKVVFGTFSATAVEPFDSMPVSIECVNTDTLWRPFRLCDYGPHLVDSSFAASFRVINADAEPIPNVYVSFWVDTTVNGTRLQNGSVSPDSAHTDSLGIVTTTWTLGQNTGDNRLVVSAHASGLIVPEVAWATGIGPPPPPDTIPAFIHCLAANGLWRFDGECTYGPAPVNSVVPVSFRVVARDSVPLPNVAMYFVVDTASLAVGGMDGLVTPDSARTDSSGIVTVNWTLGHNGGDNRLTAYAVGSGVTLQEVVVAKGVPDSIPIDSVPALIQCRDYQGIWRTEGLCAYQSVLAGTTFPALFKVTNLDTVPLADVEMEFEISHGDGSVTPDSVTTDGLGQAEVLWTVGSYNIGQQLTARIPGWNLEVSVRVGVNRPTPEKVWWENPAGGMWNDSANWSRGGVPRHGDTVLVTLPGTYNVTLAGSEDVAVGLFEIGAGDSTETQTLIIDSTRFGVDGFGAVHPGGEIRVDGGGEYWGSGLLFVVGGEIHLFEGTWAHNISLDSGAFVFDGATPKSLKFGWIVGNGGRMIWRSADTLLVFEDSASIHLRGSELVIQDTLTILGGQTSFGLTVDSAASIVFSADAERVSYLQMNGVPVVVDGEIAIDTSSEPPPGTVFDLIRLIGGGTFSGTPTLVTPGYTLEVNPVAGVGLRALKN